MNIVFTGHRNGIANINDLESIKNDYVDATWVHGGAVGFDSQVHKYAKENKIPVIVFFPNYKTYGKQAPLIRNDEMLNVANLLVALYDGRKYGGTFYTIRKAMNLGIEIVYLSFQQTPVNPYNWNYKSTNQ